MNPDLASRMSALGDAPDESGFGAPPADFHEEIRAIHEYWCSKRVCDRIPDRSDVDPVVEIPRLLGNVWLLDVETDPRRFRYRLLGSNLTSASTRPKTGSYLDEQPGSRTISTTLASIEKCCDTQTPFWRKGWPQLIHDRFVPTLEYILLPLSVDRSKDTRMLMNLTIYNWQK
ncbi:PAS domain-containing protein [Minwuia sp.]|uniref:PAS domain-containing protein n=1 Tax=Minwuia sp. TaxID=2493630 RepID=UPI003A957433